MSIEHIEIREEFPQTFVPNKYCCRLSIIYGMWRQDEKTDLESRPIEGIGSTIELARMFAYEQLAKRALVMWQGRKPE